jgi:ribosomal protein L3 glutamine methyltransferase
MSSRRKPKAEGRGGPPAGSPTALITAGAWLEAAQQWYAEHELAVGQVAADAHDEALYLILHTLGLPLDSPASVLQRSLSPAEQAKLTDVFRRRIEDRVPAAYLTREAWLGEHRFYVDERVIIPRSYFLELIPDALGARLPNRGKTATRMVDVCTGSGCLAILLAHAFPRVTVDACDLSPDALDVAKINVREHGLDDRVKLYRSDVFRDVPPAKYDVILSNPPYEPSAHVDTQAPEFAAEPRMAHDGGKDGLVIIRRLLEQSRDRLQPHGFVVIEVGGLRPAIDREFRALRPQWLPTQDGTNCVVLFEAKNLK